MGRPTKLTPERAQSIIKALKSGATYEQAADVVDVDVATIFRWKQKGEKAESGPYYEFRNSIKDAEEWGEDALLQNIIDAGKDPKHWAANAWILERRQPERWAKTDRLQVSGKDGGPLTIKVVRVSNE